MSKPTDVPESTKHLAICTDCNNPTDNCRCEDWIAEDDQRTPAASPVAPNESTNATELLADVMHLWVDGYISKAPDSRADDSISNGVFEKVANFLEAQGIEVDYCGWHRVASPVAGGSARIAEIRQRVEVARISDSALTNTLADDLEYLLKLVPEGWVKVTERLPPECTVIACDTSRVVHIAVYRPKSDEYRWDCDTYGLHASDVTHWRPLPAPPAAEEERSSL